MKNKNYHLSQTFIFGKGDTNPSSSKKNLAYKRSLIYKCHSGKIEKRVRSGNWAKKGEYEIIQQIPVYLGEEMLCGFE